MDKKIKGILIGLVLGDGHLRARERSKSVDLILAQGEKQKEYLEYKVEKLSSIINKKLRITKVLHKSYIPHRVTYRMQKAHKYFRILRKWIYKADKKTYTEHILKYLTPEGLALWYMDDGTLSKCFRPGKTTPHCCTLSIATCCSEDQALLIIKYFKEVWGISFKIRNHTNKDYKSIHCFTKEARKFIEIISPYIIESMKYKIDIPFPRNNDILTKDDDIC